METLGSVLRQSVMITAFVAGMMVAVEYVNVQTRGLWVRALGAGRLRAYLVAALLGALPGCLGAYVVVALYIHRRLSIGAVVAAMIATSGDETFVMLALFPGVAVLLTLGLAVLGVAAGAATDRWVFPRTQGAPGCDEGIALHDTETCRCFPGWRTVRDVWRAPGPYRAVLSGVIALFVVSLLTGAVGPPDWGWKRLTFLGLSTFVLFVAVTTPAHFLEEHLWRHVLRSHVPRLFLWTLGALAAMAALDAFVDLRAVVADNPWAVLLAAGALGLVPESGPHLVFVALYAAGTLPTGVLVASSAVQDGHGMLPLLAHSRADFLRVKAVNLVVGLAVGALLLAMGV